jgi:hypothetical protein
MKPLVTLSAALFLHSVATTPVSAQNPLPPLAPEQASAYASVPITRNNVYAHLISFTGEFTIDGWTNGNETLRFWTNVPVSGRPLSLPIDYNEAGSWVDRCYNASGCANHSHQWLGAIMLREHGGSIDSAYASKVSSAFSAFVGTLQAPLNTGQRNEVALKDFIHLGANTVHYRVTPKSEAWSVLFQLFTLDAQGHVAVIQETYLDNHTNPLAPPIKLDVVAETNAMAK